MRKTIYMLPAFALMLFAACSSEDAVTTESKAQLNETPENAIGFGAYMNRATTRAGAPGIMTNNSTADGNVSLEAKGFGVFGYYADGDLYSENAQPNFMYNQWVHGSAWTYAPVKYWPNEFGTSAVSTGVDRVTFFAYAPYVEVTPNTGQLTNTNDSDPEYSSATGITALTRNGKSGDPYVKYVGAFDPTKCVDLCYGVSADAFTSSVGSGDGANNIAAGKPFINVAKPTNGAKLKFLFKHALAKLTVKVDADVNVINHSTGDGVNNMTRVWVRSITFDGIAQKGYLNLNSGIWYDAVDNEKISRASVTIHDGRRDGLEASADDSYESPVGINSNLVQREPYVISSMTGIQYTSITTPETTKGVTDDYQDLFGGALYVIPANEQLKATIVYDVETADATLPTYLSDGSTNGSTIENKITKYITVSGAPLKLEPGKQYTLNLHLGLNSVEFSATVENSWTDGETPDDTWLPQNVPTVTSGDERSFSVPASTTSFVFKVAGLTAGNLITASGTTISPIAETALVGGEIQYTATLAENGTVSNVTNPFTVSDPTSPSTTVSTINVIQLAKAFKPNTANISAAGTFDITADSGSGTVTDGQWADATISIQKMLHGTTTYTDLTRKTETGAPGPNEFKYDGGSGKGTVTLGTPSVTGDKFRITFKVGNADAVTFVLTVS